MFLQLASDSMMALRILMCCAMLFNAVDALSDDDQGGPQPSEGPLFAARKRRRLSTPNAQPVGDADPQASLRAKLEEDCPCLQKICCRQFLEPVKFAELWSYLKEWDSLAKLDQDQIAS